MRAVICRAFGGPRDLVLENASSPTPGPGELLLRVRAAGVNFADILMIAGRYQIKPPFPFSPGLEAAGEVIALGSGVEGFRPGDRVMAFTGFGGFAEEVCVPAHAAYRLPTGMEWATAAAFPVIYATAMVGLRAIAGLAAGETLLVLGAAGGVGLAAVEIGNALGATVIAAAGGPEKRAAAAERGAAHLIDSRQDDIRARVKTLTAERGADVVFDPVGGDDYGGIVRAAAEGGRILIVGFASGAIPRIPANLLLIKNIAVHGYTVGRWRATRPEALRGLMEEALRWHVEGRLRPRLYRTFPLAEAADALEALRDRQVIGKVVVIMGGGHG